MPLTEASTSVISIFAYAEMCRNLSLEFSIQNAHRKMVELQWEEHWAMWRNNAEEAKYNEYYL